MRLRHTTVLPFWHVHDRRLHQADLSRWSRLVCDAQFPLASLWVTARGNSAICPWNAGRTVFRLHQEGRRLLDLARSSELRLRQVAGWAENGICAHMGLRALRRSRSRRKGARSLQMQSAILREPSSRASGNPTRKCFARKYRHSRTSRTHALQTGPSSRLSRLAWASRMPRMSKIHGAGALSTEAVIPFA
jgi:hypothetical protein